MRSIVLCVSALLLSGCITVENTHVVSIAGKLAAGGIWSETQTDKTGDLTFEELRDLLEPQAERTCVPVPGLPICKKDQSQGEKVTLPARAGAIIQTAEEYRKNKTTLEALCRYAGSKCSFQVQDPGPSSLAKPDTLP